MKARIASDRLAWLNLNMGSISLSDLHRQKRTTRAILRRLYGENKVPGVILADEVGMGKTYVALAVAAALFANYGPKKKVIVLAPSSTMQSVWRKRWGVMREKQRNVNLPEGSEIEEIREAGFGISFGSYDKMKHTTGAEILGAFYEACKGHGRPHGRIRIKLRKALFEAYGIAVPAEAKAVSLPQGALQKFWSRNYDRSGRCWAHPWAAYRDLQWLVLRSRRPRTSAADLIIFDEAHKLGGSQRQLFFRAVVNSKAKRTLFVSATPFSLNVDELIGRIEDIYNAKGEEVAKIGNIPNLLHSFRDIVKARAELPLTLKSDLESALGRYLVRNLWPEEWKNGKKRRTRLESLNVPSRYLISKEQAFATFALEQTFRQLENSGRKVHIAVDRETLCSSYRAIRVANERRSHPFEGVVNLLPTKERESPKLEFAASRIPDLARGDDSTPEKVVVFCNRNETIRELRRRLEKEFRDEETEAARRWTNARKSLRRRQWEGDWSMARLACYLYGDFTARKVAQFIAKTRRTISEAPPEGTSWDATWGPRRRIDWVASLTGDQGSDENSNVHERSNEDVQFAFNLPGPPYILLCSQVARESIDLHRWCRKIVHYDHAWNPAIMEQRVGRIDRINSRASRRQRSIEIYHFAIRGTYEERIFNVVKERMEMMRVLLGAGEWLAEAGLPREEFGGMLEKYRLDFAPREKEA